MLREDFFCWRENEIDVKSNHEMGRNERFHNTFYTVIPQLLDILERWEKNTVNY